MDAEAASRPHSRGYSTEAVTETILRRMPDYVHYICPQFTETDINFQRVPTVDTSNPFVARWIPTPDESIVVIRFRDPRGIDFPYLVSMIAGSWMSRANSIVIPGNKLDLAMQLILTPHDPANWSERKRKALTVNETIIERSANGNALGERRAQESDRARDYGQRHPRAGDGRGGEGEIRPSRHADGHGRRRDRAVHSAS